MLLVFSIPELTPTHSILYKKSTRLNFYQQSPTGPAERPFHSKYWTVTIPNGDLKCSIEQFYLLLLQSMTLETIDPDSVKDNISNNYQTYSAHTLLLIKSELERNEENDNHKLVLVIRNIGNADSDVENLCHEVARLSNHAFRLLQL